MWGRILAMLLPILAVIGRFLLALARTGTAQWIWTVLVNFWGFAGPIVSRSGFWAALISLGEFILNVFGLAGAATRNRLIAAGLNAWIAAYSGIGQVFGILGALKDLTAAELMYDLNRFMRLVKYDDPHEFLTKEEILNQYLRGNYDTATYLDEMQYLGFSASVATDIAVNATIQPTVGDLIENWKRDGDTLISIDQRLEQLGLSPEAIRITVRNSYKILTIDQLLTARLKGYVPDTAMFYNMGKQLGYEKPELDLLEASNGEPISIGQALDLWNKKEGADLAISLGVANEIEQDWSTGKGEADVNRAVVEGPLNNYWFPAIKKLRYQMLGAPDYIRFAVRDVYNAAVRAANRLDEGFPEIVGAKLRMLGYSPQDAKDAWAAHWELPSPTQVFEMLHRGKLPAGITVDDYLSSADYAPAWRQSLSDISYNPITRTDAKRMYKLRGDFDELVRHFKDNGYNDKDALDLAEFTRDDVNIEGNNERRGITSGLKNAVVSMYKNRMIDANEVRSILRSMTYTDETIEQFITEADFFRIQDEKADVASALKNAYVKALRSREDTVALLEAAGWRGQPLDDLMGTWDLLRTSTELQPHQSTTRDLTKAELLSAFGDGLLDEQQLTDALLQLGYDKSEAAVLVQHSILKKKKEDTALLVELTHQRYLGREISADDASIALDKLQVPVTQKLVSLKKWQVEREKRVPDFTLAQLEGMIKAKVMEEDTARTFLKDQGYMDSQVAYLLAWWSGKRTPPTSDTKMTKLSRSDLESMYIGDKTKRKTVHDAFVSLGYTSDEADFILDGIDRNLKRS